MWVAGGETGREDDVGEGKVQVASPASSPYVLASGGTKLITNGTTISSETVWNESPGSATGGGVSDFFPIPDYQANAQVPLEIDTQFQGRGGPDLTGDADPQTGYKVLGDGQKLVIGGSRAVCPRLWGSTA